MPEKKVNDDNYVNIQGWMINELNLKGNELITYAIIYGFTQKEGQVFSGGASYIADWINSTRQTAMNTIKSLEEKELILKVREGDISGKTNTYITTKSLVKKFDYYKNLPSQKIILDLVKIFDTPSKNFLHNIINIIYKNKDDAVHPTDESIDRILSGEFSEEDKPSKEDVPKDKSEYIPEEEKLDEKAVELKNNIRELRDIIANSTGQAMQYVEAQVNIYNFKDIDLKEFISKIKQSDFLMGKCREKPRISNFTWQQNIISIMSGNYDNKVKEDKPKVVNPSRVMRWS